MENSAQDEPILEDQFSPSPPFTTSGGWEKKKKKRINELQNPLLLIRAEFQTSPWKDKTWKGIHNKRGNEHKSICR